MSCKYSCTCGGACWRCNTGGKESYFGEAEDLLAQQMGYRDFEDHMSQNKQISQQEREERDVYEKQEQEYYEKQQIEEMYENNNDDDIQRDLKQHWGGVQ